MLLPLALAGAIGVFALTAKRSGVPKLSCAVSDFSGSFLPAETTAYFEGKNIQVPRKQSDSPQLARVLGSSSDDRWIEVDLSEQRLKAWEGDKLFLETLVSTGLAWWPTPTGEFRIWTKLKYTKMEGGAGKYYYNLPNVPYVMFFENGEIPGYRGYGLHGTYWHDDFGTRRSHGCVNLPTSVAKELFYWTGPQVSEGKGVVKVSADNQGTKIVIHE